MTKQSIDEGQFVKINGLDQWVVIRGNNVENPALLVISGPGVALSSIAPFFEMWEQDCTLVHWDQPGAGATHGANPENQGDISIERLVSDAVEVATFVQERLNTEKIAVLGISAGSVIGLTMMHTKPELFSAFVGTGQFVNWAEQDLLSYELLLENAKQEGNEEAINDLTELGPPPYSDSAGDGAKSKYHSAMTAAEMAAFPSFSGLMTEALTNPPASVNYLASGIKLEHPRTLAMAAYNAIRSDLLAFDANSMSLEFPMPIFFLQGEEDVYSITSSVQAFEGRITAPRKKTVIIEGGGHSVFWLRESFLAALTEYVLPSLEG